MTSEQNKSFSNSMASAYNPHEFEVKRYEWWESKGYFKPTKNTKDDNPHFTVIMPPPNVTGQLHLGHALTATIEDTLVRWHRMQGDATLWLPGTDHAGIATQYIVEQAIRAEGLDRRTMGRDKFLERVWEWVKQYGGEIQKQHRRLGVSADWTREKFTLDDGPSYAVKTTFHNLFQKNLIYRGERIINWCPQDLTALSDLEIEYEDIEGNLWHIEYPTSDDSGSVIVATTRPETLLGDTAVAVNPKDPRYSKFIGKQVKLPLTDRLIPIIGDEYVDIEFGTGALKITPAHDSNDFDIGKRNNLEMIDVMNPDGTMNKESGEYAGMDRFKAREKIVSDLERIGLLKQIEPYETRIGHCYRCKEIVEPRSSLQWFVDIKPLADPAIKAVVDKEISIIPQRFTQIYMNWMENIRDWCISRQLWWGHRIPVWYCADCDGDKLSVIMNDPSSDSSGIEFVEHNYRDLIQSGFSFDQILKDSERIESAESSTPIVSVENPETCPTCGSRYLIQDPDVLDTWFSSGLWTHSTLGWPENTEDYSRFYPTSVMETGYDILFFWVARMIMLGIENTGLPPFKNVYLHGLVRDPHRQKMSKTKGNVIDPLETIEKYGTDALRMALTISTTPGNDLALPDSRLEAGRNFTNKLWNGARFVINTIQNSNVQITNIDQKPAQLEDRWIISRLEKLKNDVTKMLQDFQIGQAEQLLRDFLWDEFFDWYLEMAKIRINGGDFTPAHTLAEVLEQSCLLLHPFMPFVTEEIWQALVEIVPKKSNQKESIMISSYPISNPSLIDEEAEDHLKEIFEVTRAIRNLRAEQKLDPYVNIEVLLSSEKYVDVFERNREIIEVLAKASPLIISALGQDDSSYKNTTSIVLDYSTIIVPLDNLVDIEEEKDRIEEEIKDVESRIKQLENRLSNSDFTSKAPAPVVEKERKRFEESAEKLKNLTAQLQNLK
tara:strand:- start:27833 stop:30670 length:2838 start_codon:yes stop_codon:yes gene_type:complete